MSFRVIHYEGTKESLLNRLKTTADILKNEYNEAYWGSYWKEAVDKVVKGNFTDAEAAADVLAKTIDENFNPVSDGWKISIYDILTNKTTGVLKNYFEMFQNGRNFSTGESGFGHEVTAGYLTPDEVKTVLNELKNYTPDQGAEEEREFIEHLIHVFDSLAEKNSGDLFVMS
jgi:hypothetical protein